MHIIGVLVRETSQKSLHIKAMNHTASLLVARGRLKILAIGVEQTRKAADKSCANLLGVERCGADNTGVVDASGMGICIATATFIDSVLGLFFADGANRPVIVKMPLEAVAFHPIRGFRVSHGLHENMRHDG